MLTVELNQYSERRKLYESTHLCIEPGITVLIGPNGSGKTYACSQLKDHYEHTYFADIVAETKLNYSRF